MAPLHARRVWRLAALQPLVSPSPPRPSLERGGGALDSRLTSSLSGALAVDLALAIYFPFFLLAFSFPSGSRFSISVARSLNSYLAFFLWVCGPYLLCFFPLALHHEHTLYLTHFLSIFLL